MLRAGWNGTVIAEAPRTVVMESNHYFPPEALHREYFGESRSRSLCFWKGLATRAMREKVNVLERGSEMVLAAHYTALGGRWKAVTVETVRLTRPERVDFRLVRGAVPYVVESFTLTEQEAGIRLLYEGELGTDLWRTGQWWGRR
ncbi:DUF427 domain-containing protein [Streptomyces sp. NPDC015127]|uniref:DUF427 domain-containing protein n=1 Tax=Streptomyces sp. NPDC015127 TaxID=3364939 RepID=UPI0037009538